MTIANRLRKDGVSAVMASDLSHTPISSLQVAIDGDAHINNFGLYGTPQRDVVMDLNDFDEATLGPWEWDLKRLVASVNVAGRENGFNRKERRSAVSKCVAGYALNSQRLKEMGVLDTWSIYAYADLERQMPILKQYGSPVPIEFLVGEPFEFWAWACGALLSRAHAQTGDAAKIAGYIGKGTALAASLAEFAERYGDQTEKDHAALVEAIRSGRVAATQVEE